MDNEQPIGAINTLCNGFNIPGQDRPWWNEKNQVRRIPMQAEGMIVFKKPTFQTVDLRIINLLRRNTLRDSDEVTLLSCRIHPNAPIKDPSGD